MGEDIDRKKGSAKYVTFPPKVDVWIDLCIYFPFKLRSKK